MPVIDKARRRSKPPAHAGLSSETPVSHGKSLQIQNGVVGIGIGIGIPLDDSSGKRRNVNAPIGFSSQIEFLVCQTGKLGLEKCLECFVTIERTELIRPGYSSTGMSGDVLDAVVVVAVTESHRGGLIDNQNASESCPRIRIVHGGGNPCFFVFLRGKTIIGKHERANLGEQSKERRGSRPSVGPINQRKIFVGSLLIFCLNQNVVGVDHLSLQFVVQIPGIPGRGQGLIPSGKRSHSIGM
mmetsp:Transcript_15704/g.39507  ORF Transcript_15704/g.39507 Transcript_15704/m.39507 type:complete len:241 (+) Transcript_15704:876-1598(+)